MEIDYSETKIEFEKELNALDRFTIDFTSILDKLNIKYVLVSGYVSILFGRSRSSEDIDLIIEKLDFNMFQKLWQEIHNTFGCINTQDSKDAYSEYLLKENAIRFSKKDKYIPNMEVKFPKEELDLWTLEHRKKVILNNNIVLFISPLELQIPFKLLLGSEKDIEDAKHLYNLFKEYLNQEDFDYFIRKLNIKEVFNEYIK